MEMFSKIVLLVFAFYWCMFGSETDEAECIDMWPFCYIYNPPCINNTDHLCPKQCGLCTSSENDTHSANMTCEDKVDDCSSFNLSEGCQSNNTWYREHCRNSCNMCLSENVTREDGSKIRDQDSSLHTRNNVYHNSVKNALEAECIDRWPYCYVFNPPCLNHTDNKLEVRGFCPKQCGLCSHQESDKQSADTTCRDKLDCSPFNLSEGCQSNNTWYREHCRLSCNVCLSDNGTTEKRETDDQESTPHTGSNISHTSTKDALGSTFQDHTSVDGCWNMVIIQSLNEHAESACKDDQVCTQYLLSTNCLSNKTWIREHCPKSCNVCQTEMPSTTDNITTVDFSREDISLILNIAKSTEYTYHTSSTAVIKDNTFATSVTAAIIASIITFTVTLAAVLICRKQANMGVECCPEHNTNIYDEIGNVNAYEDHKASSDNSKYKMLIIRNMDGHSDTVTYLHPFDDPTYTQSLEV